MTRPAPTAFLRGFVTSALLAALQDRKGAPDGRKVLRYALQGGAALAAGTVAATALSRRDYRLALGAAALGAAGVLVAEHLLSQDTKENHRGEEEA